METGIIDTNSRYRLTGRYLVGLELVGLEVTDYKGNKKVLKISDIHTLIKNGAVVGCSIVERGGVEYIKSISKISNLPIIDISTDRDKKLEVQSRVIKDGKCIGYTAKDTDNKVYRLSKDKVWELATRGNVTNMKASASNKNKILTGLGKNIADLPEVEV